ncbi:MAG: DNA-binding response regulator [bacterium]|nr:DNA-binding response regulator [bacterium]
MARIDAALTFRFMSAATEQPQLTTAQLLDDGPILVVDDDEALRRLCTRVLAARGYEVHTACDGEEAVRKVQSHAYRVVLLDLKMPGMDGIECLKQMKARGCRADVVMITGYGNVPTAVEAMKVGARDFIEKPFRPQDLHAMLEDILQRQSRDAQLSTDPVVAFIQQHAVEISSRKDVADRLGVSLERVSTRVQEEMNCSFREFLHACRLNLAKRLLETTELDISEVSTRTGFQTVQHFSRVFSKRAGVSPKKYRLQSRAES